MPRITRVLIANRGEIAVRVIRAARDAGIASIAVYADQDAGSLHTRLADTAYPLGGTTSGETYLAVDKILVAAREARADAVHPGYGFLSENAGFARAVITAGLLWVGPPPDAIEELGDKVLARRVARKVGAPLVAGTPGPVSDPLEAVDFARRFGLPIAVKAAFGGGGRGLRVARTIDEIPRLFEAATREAAAAFGRGDCYVEKYLDRPRHVETQCIADAAGHVVVISTRDCSLQRRHQKLVEEAPAPFLSPAQSQRIYRASKEILREVGYTSAGTCEFLVGRDGTVSFLEVNTRLQVEHTVSEEVSGIDLVREQFRIAEGGLIDYGDPAPRGHSFEFRVNAEDPGLGFLPSPGTVRAFSAPAGPGVRVDSGVAAGDPVPDAFDSLLAKLVVTGRDRAEALQRSRRALAEFEVAGLPTVLPFHRKVAEDTAFAAADPADFTVHTNWIETDFHNDIPPWPGEQPDGPGAMRAQDAAVVEIDGRFIVVALPAGASHAARPTGPQAPGRAAMPGGGSRTPDDASVTAPMRASVVRVEVSEGDTVRTGDLLLVLEAMKMEHSITARRDGTVSELAVKAGDAVAAGYRLLRIA